MEQVQPDVEAVVAARKTINNIVGTEVPFRLNSKPLMEASFASMMRKIAKENQKRLRDMSVKENFKLCRKRCKLFKCNECYKKTYEEQKHCYETHGYEQTNQGETNEHT